MQANSSLPQACRTKRNTLYCLRQHPHEHDACCLPACLPAGLQLAWQLDLKRAELLDTSTCLAALEDIRGYMFQYAEALEKEWLLLGSTLALGISFERGVCFHASLKIKEAAAEVGAGVQRRR